MNFAERIRRNTQDILFFAGLVLAVWLTFRIGNQIDPETITSEQLLTIWRQILGIMVLFIILASALITDNLLFGWLINEQNRMSLSRLQMFLWTIVILSAFVTAVFANIRFGHVNVALTIGLPEELWLAMGISTTSLVGTGLILESKKDKHPKKVQLKNVKNRDGLLDKKVKPSLLDLIRGEEVSNSDKIDLTRLQNLLFTFVLVGSYMVSLNEKFTMLVTKTDEVKDIATNFPVDSFPELGASAIALLTISHAGYLVAKAVDKQPAEESGETETPQDPVG